MYSRDIFSFRHTQSLLWIISIFMIVMVITGCSKKDAAIENLKKDKITITADSLVFFSSKGDLDRVKLLLDAGVNVNDKDTKGATALIAAAWAGQPDVVAYLLEAKADVNAESATKLTALIAAVNQKHEQITLLLLDKGANPNVVDATGLSPLIAAAWQGNSTVVRAMTEKGADVNYKKSDDGLTAMKAAVAANKPEVAQHLRSRGATE